MFHPRGPTFFELARQALSSTERGYDLLAPKFDLTPFRTPDAVLEATAEVLGAVGDALDLCCGTGAALEMLWPRCRGRVAGVDFSRGMLAEARRRLDASAVAGALPVELIRADVLELDFDNAFDAVTCLGALGHFRRRQHSRLVATVARALRPGGRFVFAAGERPPFTSRRLWLAAGFDADGRPQRRLAADLRHVLPELPAAARSTPARAARIHGHRPPLAGHGDAVAAPGGSHARNKCRAAA